MDCTSPVLITPSSGNKRAIRVPCGYCAACRVTRSSQWAMRIQHELWAHEYKGCFVTLTYNDEHQPDGGTLVKADLQDYIKRLRKAVAPRRVKYYAVGEYGERYNRPHYHLALLGMLPYGKDINIIKDAWSLAGKEIGFVHVGSLMPASIRYVTDYILKKYMSWDKEEERQAVGGRLPPYVVMSKKFGVKQLEAQLDYVQSTGMICYNGKDVPLPKLYKQYANVPIGVRVANALERQRKIETEYDIPMSYDRRIQALDYGIEPGTVVQPERMVQEQRQRDRNILAKAEIRKLRKEGNL